MAPSTTVRRGLPRRPGGEPWPVVAEPAASEAAEPAASEVGVSEVSGSALPGALGASEPLRRLRRGLPRVPGGEAWPHATRAAARPAEAAHAPDEPVPGDDDLSAPFVEATPEPEVVVEPAPVTAQGSGAALRRGLPRSPGGEPWPAAGFAPSAPAAVEAPSRAAVVAERPAASEVSAPLAFEPTVFPGAAGREWNEIRRGAASVRESPEPQRIGPFTRLQWAGAAIVGGGGIVVAAALVVLATRWVVSLPGLQDFLVTYPGEYHLPESAPVGVPAWLNWQHFLNSFFLVLIIRSGLQVRREKRPRVFWSPRGNARRKISLALWFHQALDVLWLANGVLFVVLLFATGQWIRIVPTSWDVVPNALSAALQYVSLDWPTENGWVNYNSLQQLAYFSIVFVAAPLAAITGVRMSGVWPKALDRLYPVEWARAVHFPVMIYFVLFIVVHVALVFATGALRNLNHMYAALGSTDPGAYAANWAGFWIFVVSTLAIAAAWVAARPLVLAPIARLFGTVKGG